VGAQQNCAREATENDAVTYQGHMENGVVVLDEPASLADGVKVTVELVSTPQFKTTATPLRGMPYHFDEPLAPAIDENAWEAGQ